MCFSFNACRVSLSLCRNQWETQNEWDILIARTLGQDGNRWQRMRRIKVLNTNESWFKQALFPFLWHALINYSERSMLICTKALQYRLRSGISIHLGKFRWKNLPEVPLCKRKKKIPRLQPHYRVDAQLMTAQLHGHNGWVTAFECRNNKCTSL